MSWTRKLYFASTKCSLKFSDSIWREIITFEWHRILPKMHFPSVWWWEFFFFFLELEFYKEGVLDIFAKLSWSGEFGEVFWSSGAILRCGGWGWVALFLSCFLSLVHMWGLDVRCCKGSARSLSTHAGGLQNICVHGSALSAWIWFKGMIMLPF